MIGTRIGPQIGSRVGSRVGLVRPGGATWTLDATSGKAVPQTEAEANALLAAAGASGSAIALYRFGLVSATPVPDDVGSRDLTIAGTVALEQTVAGWSTKSAKTTAGTSGTLQNTTFSNVNATSYTVYVLAKITVPLGALRTVFRMGDIYDDDATVECNATPVLSIGEGDATRTLGVSNPTGAVRPFVLRIDDTGNTVDAFTDQEKITGGAQACNGTALLFGGDNTQTNFPADCDYLLALVVNAAHSNAVVKAVIEEFGFTVPWSP